MIYSQQSEGFLEDTVEVWQPYYRDELSLDDAAEITRNWASYIELISIWVESKSHGVA